MSKANSQTMTVRLPTEIARDLMKLRNTKNLSTVGSALKYWIDQEIEAGRDTRILKLEEALKERDEVMRELLVKAHQKVNILACGVVGIVQGLAGGDKNAGKEIIKSLREIDKRPVKKLEREVSKVLGK